MKNFITDSWHDEECFIECDCECEGLSFFLDTTNNESLFGLRYFRSFNDKKKIAYYQEFGSRDEFNNFVEQLTPNSFVKFICLREYYGMYAGWEDNQNLIVEAYKFNKKFKQGKKPIFQLSFSKDKVDQLREELKSWLERHEN